MVVFTEKQIKILRGNLNDIGDYVGCSVQYVMCVIKGRRPQNTELAQKIIEKSQELLKVFER